MVRRRLLVVLLLLVTQIGVACHWRRCCRPYRMNRIHAVPASACDCGPASFYAPGAVNGAVHGPVYGPVNGPAIVPGPAPLPMPMPAGPRTMPASPTSLDKTQLNKPGLMPSL
jgi:hypothetical protein